MENQFKKGDTVVKKALPELSYTFVRQEEDNAICYDPIGNREIEIPMYALMLKPKIQSRPNI